MHFCYYFFVLLLNATCIISQRVNLQQITNKFRYLMENTVVAMSPSTKKEILPLLSLFENQIQSEIQENLIELQNSNDKHPNSIYLAAQKTISNLQAFWRNLLLHKHVGLAKRY